MNAEITTQTWMLDAAIRGTVLVALALTANVLLSRTSASLRHRLLTSALCCLLALPALVIVVPPWHVAVLPSTDGPAGNDHDPALAALRGAGTGGADAADASDLDRREVNTIGRDDERVASTREGQESSAGITASLRHMARQLDPARIAIGLWLAGTLLLLLTLARGVGAAWWTARSATLVTDPAWNRSAREIADQLGLRGHVQLLRSPRVSMPMAWGLRRQAVLLPAAAEGWSAARRHAVLAHELAHLRRRDCAVLLMTRIVTALYWFNPLVWIAAAQQAAQRERACDDAVLRTGTDRGEYAEHLLAIARAAAGARDPGWAVVTMARRSQLEGRLLAVLDARRDRRHASRSWDLALSFGVIVLLVPLAAFRPAVAAPDGLAEQVARDPVAGPVAADGVSGGPASAGSQEERAPGVATSPPSASQSEAADDAVEQNPRPDPEPRAVAAARARARAGQQADPERLARRQRVVETMGRILRDEDAGMREQAAHSLGEMEDPAAIPALSDALAVESEPGVREQIAWALGMIEDPAAVPVLSDSLSDTDAGVREQAAWALGMIEDPAAVDALSAALSDAELGVREQAIWALGMIESPSAVPGLLTALGDTDAGIREKAAWSLGMIESSEAVDGLVALLGTEPDASVREQVVWALGMIEDERALDALIDAVEDVDEGVRKQALWALGKIVD